MLGKNYGVRYRPMKTSLRVDQHLWKHVPQNLTGTSTTEAAFYRELPKFNKSFVFSLCSYQFPTRMYYKAPSSVKSKIKRAHQESCSPMVPAGCLAKGLQHPGQP